jgi:hypothetical protein
VEDDLTAQPPRAVRTRFELAIRRMTDAWIASGRLAVSATDVQLAREFLEAAGWKIEDIAEARLRVVNRDGRAEEMSREQAVMAALRRLAKR